MKDLGISITKQEAEIEGKKDKYSLAAQYGFSREELDRGYGSPHLGTWEEALRLGKVILYPEASGVLNYLRNKGVILGLLSRATRESDVALKVQHFGLGEFFEDRIVVVSDGVKKDEGVLNLLKKMPPLIETAHFIGDRAEDVTVADYLRNSKGINAEGIYVNRSGHSHQELARYPQVRTLIEIPKLVLRRKNAE